MQNERGRPPEFDEPLIRRTFELPESLNEKLETARGPKKPGVRRLAAVEIVRDALESKLSGAPSESTSQVAAIREAVTDALRENGVLSLACNPAVSTQGGAVPHGVFVKANAGQLAQLAEMGDETGLGAPEDILSALMRQALQMRPEQLQTLLVGDFGQTAIRTPRAAPSQKPKKKAA